MNPEPSPYATDDIAMIHALRDVIDGIDEKILELICTRLEVVQKIGGIKARYGYPIVDGAREAALLSRLDKINRGPLTSRGLHHIFTGILTASREIQMRPERSSS